MTNGIQQITVSSTKPVIIDTARKINRLGLKSRGRLSLAATMFFLRQDDQTILDVMSEATQHVVACGGKP